jgi:hypothetical protein
MGLSYTSDQRQLLNYSPCSIVWMDICRWALVLDHGWLIGLCGLAKRCGDACLKFIAFRDMVLCGELLEWLSGFAFKTVLFAFALLLLGLDGENFRTRFDSGLLRWLCWCSFLAGDLNEFGWLSIFTGVLNGLCWCCWVFWIVEWTCCVCGDLVCWVCCCCCCCCSGLRFGGCCLTGGSDAFAAAAAAEVNGNLLVEVFEAAWRKKWN